MTRLAPLLVALAALAPGLAAAQDAPDAPEDEGFPPALLDLLDAWMDEAADAGEAPGADAYLRQARDAADAGRFRVALFHLDTHRQLLGAQRLLEEAGTGSAAEQRTRVLALSQTWRRDAEGHWEEYRAALRAFDGAKSAQAVELALYSADVALLGAVQLVGYEDAARAYRSAGAVDQGHLASLARSTRGVSYQLELARDLLDAAGALEGLPPRLDGAAWNATLDAALGPVDAEQLPYYLQPMETTAGDSRARGERLLALALHLAQARDARVSAIQQQFGDAAARGIDAARDAALGIGRAADNLSVAQAREDGLLGVFTADALDRAQYTVPLLENGTIGLGPASFTWASLDHQTFANQLLLDALAAGTDAARTPSTNETGAPVAALAAGAALVAALLTRRRT